jgi:hypothetical protein
LRPQRHQPITSPRTPARQPAMQTLTGKSEGEHHESERGLQRPRPYFTVRWGAESNPNVRSNAIPTTYERVRRGRENLHQFGGVSSRLDPNNNNNNNNNGRPSRPRPRFQGSIDARSKRGSSTVSFLVLRGSAPCVDPFAAAQVTARSTCTTRDDGTLS